jgi:hypothetical protein
MASNRTVYHVVPDASADRWVISRENEDSFREEYRNREEAVDAAKARARGEEPSQVKVHRSDGNMEYERTYGDDPRQTPSSGGDLGADGVGRPVHPMREQRVLAKSPATVVLKGYTTKSALKGLTTTDR